jgi:ATP-dependent protease ClpP protease subunit
MKKASRSWYRIAARAGESETSSIEVFLYEEIGIYGITAGQFIKDFNAIDDGKSPVVVAINSIGGSFFDSIAMNAWMERLGERVTARIDGLAASGASLVAVGAHRVIIGKSAMMMIHNPMTFAFGDANDLRKISDDMEKARDSILAAYKRKATAIDDDELIRMLDDETWLNAEEAVALGLADIIGEEVKIMVCQDITGVLARYKHTPIALLAGMDRDESAAADPLPAPPNPSATPPPSPAPPPAPDIARIVARSSASIVCACLKAGIPEITEVILMKTTLTDEAAVAAEAERIQAVHDLCVAARLPELAADYAASGLSAESVRARLFDKIVQAGGPEIDNKEPVVEAPKTDANKLDPVKIYAARKGKAQSKSVKGDKQ